MPEVKRTPAAKEDLLEIWLYIARDNPEAADRLSDSIDKKCRLLATQPKLGPARPDLGADVRSLPVGNYLILYRPLQNGTEVLRVVHGARDIPAVFREHR